MIVDRAPNAKAVAEIFIDEGGARVEWELRELVAGPVLRIEPGGGGMPRQVVIAPPAGSGPEELGFVVYHRGLPVSDLHYLTRPETLDLNWADPWESRFQNHRLRRRDDSPLSVFLYVEPFEVRVEIMGRPGHLGVTDPRDVRREAAASLEGRWELLIDGERARAVLDRVQFLERRLRTSFAVDPPPPAGLPFATVGAIYVVERDGLPETASLTWTSFDEAAPAVSGSVTDASVTWPARLTAERATLTWENLGGIEAPSLASLAAPPPLWGRFLPFAGMAGAAALLVLAVLVGIQLRRGRRAPRIAVLAGFLLLALTAATVSRGRATPVSQEEAEEVVHALLYNTYRAFDRRQEEAVYDTLARSVAGELLTEVYLEARRSLAVESLGGAMTRVRDVAIESAVVGDAADWRGFEMDCTWVAAGSVGHWGHVHERSNRYHAKVSVRAVDGVWKIAGLDLLNEERL